jgi:hypothetical protein
MSGAIGCRRWAIAEGYIPPASTGTTRELTSHETLCILNAGEEEARVEITVYFADRAPAGPYVFKVGAQRTLHLRFNDFRDPEPVPKGTDFSSVVTANVPVVVQHTRLDTRQPALALLSTIAFPLD